MYSRLHHVDATWEHVPQSAHITDPFVWVCLPLFFSSEPSASDGGWPRANFPPASCVCQPSSVSTGWHRYVRRSGQRFTLLEHTRTVHEKWREFCCPICNMGFSRRHKVVQVCLFGALMGR